MVRLFPHQPWLLGVGVNARARGMSLACALGACAFYLLTGARDLTWAHSGADGGDLITAAWVGGVPHPSGYPLWLWLAQGFLALPVGSPAWRAGLVSVLGGALAVGAMVRAAARLLPPDLSPRWQLLTLLLVALSLVVSPLLWGQSVIVEVYALQAGLLALTLDGLLGWLLTPPRDGQPSATRDEGAHHLRRAALGWGLALANHLTVVWLAPSILWFLWQRRPPLALLRHCVLLLLCGPLLYLTLPIRASALSVVNWGGAYTFEGLRWLVSGVIYRSFVFSIPASDFFPRLASWAALLTHQFGPIGLILVLWGAAVLGLQRPQLVGALMVFVLLNSIYALGYNTTDSFIYLLPNSLVMALWLARGIALIPDELGPRWSQGSAALGLALLLGGALPGVTLFRFGAQTAQWHPQPAATYVAESLAVLPEGAIVFAETDEHIFAMWYAAYVVAPSKGIIVVVDPLLHYEWYRESLRVNHAALRWPATATDARALLEANRTTGQLYLTEEDDATVADLPKIPAGPLWHLP